MAIELASRADFTLAHFRRAAWQGEPVAFTKAALARMAEARAQFLGLIETDPDITIYGVTSGYGQHANKRLNAEERKHHARRPPHGPAVAFGIPGILMGIATLIFWLGRNQYVKIPPTGKNPHSFVAVVQSALKNRGRLGSFLDGARVEHPDEAVEGAKAVFRVLSIFAFIPFFWMLFDQKASTWVVQARSMDLRVGTWNFEPSQMQLVNPALVMLLIPVTTGIVYPFFKRLGWELTPLRRMPIGMALGATSFVIAGLLNVPVASGQKISVVWQVLPYVVLTIGEILVSVTGLEFAYTQAPLTMKSVIQSFWNLTTAAANLAVALASAFVFFSGTALFFYYAGFAYLAAAGLALVARRYKVVEWYQRAPAPQPVQREAPLAEPA